MSNLQKKVVDRDLMVLDEVIGDCSLPERDWESIINVYNYNNKPFPIPPLVCAKIVEDIKKGRIPKTVFAQYGISYINFNNRFNKTKSIIENLSSQAQLTDEEWNIIETCKRDPAFILGMDIHRVRAFHFNKATDFLQEESKVKPDIWLTYMKEIHKEQFEDKQDKNSVEVTIQFAPGLLEAI